MPLRVAMIAAECEPWAKTGGLGDVVDALARALPHVPNAIDGEVEVFLPRYRSVPVPAATSGSRVVRVPDPRAQDGVTELTIVDVAADGYRLRLVDHPPAFDRDGMYGPPSGGDFPDNAWRYGLFCRAALETLRTEPERPVDILHLHDWHSGPAAIQRDAWLADDPVLGRAAIAITLHNLAYHGWTGREQLRQLGLVPGGGVIAAAADGIDLLREGIVRAEVANTVSPGFAREALTPEGSFGLADALAAKGDRFVGILNGLDTVVCDPVMGVTFRKRETGEFLRRRTYSLYVRRACYPYRRVTRARPAYAGRRRCRRDGGQVGGRGHGVPLSSMVQPA
jgi:starch synthase